MAKRNDVELDDADHTGDEESPARPIWSGTITFGLVSIPVDLFAAVHSRPSLRMLAPDGTPLRRQPFCPEEEKPIERDELVRGYEIERGEFVLVTDEELEGLAPKKSRDIDLQQFVPIEQLPPLLFERGYFLAPSGGSTKAYRLLAKTMADTNRAGIATFVMRERSYLIAIVAEKGIMRAETLRYFDEVRTPEDLDLDALPEPKPAQLKKMRTRVKKLSQKDLAVEEELHDEWAERLRKLAEQKAKQGKGVVELSEDELPPPPEVVDLAEVLKQRLSGKTKTSAGSKSRARSRAR